jgi:hypothetical protein
MIRPDEPARDRAGLEAVGVGLREMIVRALFLGRPRQETFQTGH